MPTRQNIAQAAAAALASAPPLHALLGFDGFVDQICDVVATRYNHTTYDRLPTIESFGNRVLAAAGKSANLELVTQHQKLGGNGPLMANALATLGLTTTYIGTVGSHSSPQDAIDPVFHDFAKKATLIPLAPPAHTTALEFSDGKIMLGNLAPLSQVTWEKLIQVIGIQQLTALFQSAHLLGMLNWTMLPHLSDIWQNAATHILPNLKNPKQKRLFIDLADPEKRPPTDFKNALNILSNINLTISVTLGLNLSEAHQTAKILNLPTPNTDLPALAAAIRLSLNVDTVVIHPRDGAAAANPIESTFFSGPFTPTPKISTGAGDHFNAGFSLGQLLNLPLDQSLCLGTATSGYYVRHAQPPTKQQLTAFLQNLPEPQ